MTLASSAEALFLSSLQPSDDPTSDDVSVAIRASIVAHGGLGGCVNAFAREYGDHPDTATKRMRWSLDLVSNRWDAVAAA
jgi:hypothetical protein